jgi:hypothetical protein
LLAVLKQRARFGPAVIPFPDLDRVRLVNDKALLMARAPEADIAVPQQLVLETAGQRSALNAAELRFPLVIKPSRSVASGSDGRLTKLGVLHAADAAQLSQVLEALLPEAYPVLLQQRIVGPGIGVFLLVWNGETKAVFSHCRIREKTAVWRRQRLSGEHSRRSSPGGALPCLARYVWLERRRHDRVQVGRQGRHSLPDGDQRPVLGARCNSQWMPAWTSRHCWFNWPWANRWPR